MCNLKIKDDLFSHIYSALRDSSVFIDVYAFNGGVMLLISKPSEASEIKQCDSEAQCVCVCVWEVLVSSTLVVFLF